MAAPSVRAKCPVVLLLALLPACHVEDGGARQASRPALDPSVKVTVDLGTGITTRYREAGNPGGDPVVLLHGFTDTSRSFLPAMRHLARLRPDLHLLAPDLRGHGDATMPSPEACRRAPEQCFRPADFAADVISFMDAKGIARAYLVGHSLGSGVAQEVALTSPARVRRLVLIGSAARFAGHPALTEFMLGGLVDGAWKKALEAQGRRWPDDAYEMGPRDADPNAEAWLRENWVFNPVADPDLLAAVLRETVEVRLGTWIGAARALNAYDNVERLKQLSVPTLVLWPTQDVFFLESPDQALLRASLDAAAEQCRTTYYFKTYGRRPLPESGAQENDLGHNPQWDAPEGVAIDLAAYLKENGEPTRDLFYANPENPRVIETAPGEATVLVRRGEICPPPAASGS